MQELEMKRLSQSSPGLQSKPNESTRFTISSKHKVFSADETNNKE